MTTRKAGIEPRVGCSEGGRLNHWAHEALRELVRGRTKEESERRGQLRQKTKQSKTSHENHTYFDIFCWQHFNIWHVVSIYESCIHFIRTPPPPHPHLLSSDDLPTKHTNACALSLSLSLARTLMCVWCVCVCVCAHACVCVCV